MTSTPSSPVDSAATVDRPAGSDQPGIDPLARVHARVHARLTSAPATPDEAGAAHGASIRP